MREIKFRAKSVDGQLVYGIPIKTHVGTYMVTEENPHVCSVYGYMEIDEFVKVDENTIGQFTGMMDKDGKEIYEGDILDLFIPKNNVGKPEHRLRKVIFDEKSCGFSIVDKHNDCICDAVTTSIELIYTVIGNIHDNPELMEENQ